MKSYHPAQTEREKHVNCLHLLKEIKGNWLGSQQLTSYKRIFRFLKFFIFCRIFEILEEVLVLL